ncbi:PepSY domain-containing protein [Pontibacter sp. Tf4]|uniref:PepSY domain-containing protein n=1 Tax=Pontibacter sp. Tf4 TaxID=2761620 RepID=UPI001627ED86|nr:PepSY domain-containing protein [Pontibacter sp. Tf4]MBB6611671.1 PepSY domain-containing protein [Pontibacter sp. Tf4]
MKLKSRHYYIRKSHRYLGLVLGIQFLFWTIGGLYFSWNDIDEVHGDHLRSEKRYFPADLRLISPQVVLDNLKTNRQVDSVAGIQLAEINGEPVYQVRYFTGNADHATGEAGGHSAMAATNQKVQLARAATGEFIPALTKEQAVAVASNQLKAPVKVEKVEYLTEAGAHHEYREKPLPAWAITYSQPANCTVYVSAELGTFQAIRHNQWRMFDFLWMLHTMDYESRDNFGNLLLRVFSVLGLLTVVSGFVLYFVSSPRQKKATAYQKVNR